MSSMESTTGNIYNAVYFRDLCAEMAGKASGVDNVTSRRCEKELFGVSLVVCSAIWNAISTKIPHSCKPKHLLWGLIFLKVYSNESIHCIIAGCDPRTFCKWSWHIVEILADLPMVCVVLM